MDPNSPSQVLAPGGLKRTNSGGSFGGNGSAHPAMGSGSQDQHNNALRKMLGMPPATSAPKSVLARRSSNVGMRNDLFSM